MTKAQFEEIVKTIKDSIGAAYRLGLHLDNGETIVGKTDLLGTRTLMVTTSTQQVQFVDLEKVSWISVV